MPFRGAWVLMLELRHRRGAWVGFWKPWLHPRRDPNP